jgi:thioester reductase-like protein
MRLQKLLDYTGQQLISSDEMAFHETIFVTGFPGFIAGRLVERLAREGARFILLVQSSLVARARQDIAGILAKTGAGQENFSIVEGDITSPDLGLSPEDLNHARAETHTLFHLAANYDLAVERELAQRVNVQGTDHVNQFAKSIPNLKRYHYVSTCYVAGRRRGLIREDELRHDAGFRNHYEESKYLAELSVDELKSELPVTIHRPAVVVGDSNTGETAKYDGIYYLIHYLRKWPGGLSLINIGNSEVSLNLVPIDFVIEAMVALAKDERAAGATVQIADPVPLTTEQLFDAIAETVAGRKSAITIPRNLVYPVLMAPGAPKITGLPHSAVPYFFLEQAYETTHSQQLLEPHGVRCPAFPNYVDSLVAFVREHPTL